MNRYLRFKTIKKIVSLLLVFQFLHSNSILWAQVDGSLFTKAIPFHLSEQALLDNWGIAIPENCGEINSFFKGDDTKLIIHVQDAHCNYQAQKNYAEMLRQIAKSANVKKRNLNLIGLEGATSLLDLLKYAALPDKKIKERLINYFLEKGYLTGAEYFAIMTNNPIILHGVDNKNLYLQNLRLFQENSHFQKQGLEELSKIETLLNILRAKVFSEKLLKLITIKEAFTDQEIKFTDYSYALSELSLDIGIDYRKYTNFEKIIKTSNNRRTQT